MTRIIITDTTLRDGSHAVSHLFTPEQMARVAQGLDEAGVDIIESCHGEGLAGSSFQYGFGAATDREYLAAISPVLKRSKLAVLVLPGIATKVDLQMAHELGASVVRVATHVTEADIGQQHIQLAKKLGMFTVAFLMMAHMVSPEEVAYQASLFESYGADVVYVTDSAGAMLPDDVKARVEAVLSRVKIPVGHHAHNNLMVGIANSLAAVESGATYIDGTLRGLGGGAGNAPTEVLAAVFNRRGYETNLDLYKVMDVAENVLQPMMHRPQQISNASLMLGYVGVYSSFLLHAQRAAEKFGVDPRAILAELGRRKIVGGQEDIIVDVAYELSKAQAG